MITEEIISELHKIQKDIELLENEVRAKENMIIIDPKIKGLRFENGYYTDSTVNDSTINLYFAENYRQEYDSWYRSYLRREDEKRLSYLRGQEYQIRKIIWRTTGSWKIFDKDNYALAQ